MVDHRGRSDPGLTALLGRREGPTISQTIEGPAHDIDERPATGGGTAGEGSSERTGVRLRWVAWRRTRRARRRERRLAHPMRTRVLRVLSALLAAFVLTCAVSFLTSEIGQPGSLSARFAEWARDHGGGNVVADIENFWYSHHQPAKGGAPPPGAIPAAPVTAPTTPLVTVPGTLPPPSDITPLVQPALPGEGAWHPAGRTYNGVPVVYEAFVRPSAVYTSQVAGVAWMDATVLHANLYSGSYIPGGGPWKLTAPIQSAEAQTLVAAFNSGFRLQDAGGGYYTQGQMVAPLKDGAASVVIFRDGSMTVGQWGRDVVMGPNVVAVRQNLRLLVDNGVPAPDLSMGAWGATLHNDLAVWRSGLGVTAGGALVYAAGPALDVPSLAKLLQRAGAVRAMELDINTDWVNFSAYNPTSPNTAADASNGQTLLSTMSGGAGRFFTASWNRDFFTLSLPDGAGNGLQGGGRH